MKLIVMALFATGIWSQSLRAHEGHDHDAPTTLKAPKGGVIKALDESRIEVVYKSQDLKIYLYDKEMNPSKASDFKIIAFVELPRSKKQESLSLETKNTYFEGIYDAKGAHRYTLKLAVTDSKTNRTDNLTFTIEPRK